MKLKKFHAFAAVLLAITTAGPACAQWIDRQGKRLPETEQMKSQGDLGVNIVLTPNEAKFRDTWNKSSTTPRLDSIDKVGRGGAISAMIMFHGCVAGASGACNALVRYALETPDGKIIPTGEGPLWTGRPIMGKILMSNSSVTIGFDKSDAAGKYKIHATVIDKVSGRQLQVSAPFTLQ